ncbi:hypothetical protein V8C35DRAFT_22568 [Trichoderma chlorosporum]
MVRIMQKHSRERIDEDTCTYIEHRKWAPCPHPYIQHKGYPPPYLPLPGVLRILLHCTRDQRHPQLSIVPFPCAENQLASNPTPAAESIPVHLRNGLFNIPQLSPSVPAAGPQTKNKPKTANPTAKPVLSSPPILRSHPIGRYCQVLTLPRYSCLVRRTSADSGLPNSGKPCKKKKRKVKKIKKFCNALTRTRIGKVPIAPQVRTVNLSLGLLYCVWVGVWVGVWV